MLNRPALAATLLLIPTVLTACSSADGGPAAQPSDGDATCSYPTDPTGSAKPVDVPESEPTATGKQKVTISTSQGDIPLTLDADAAPCTVNSFLSLASQGYFDGTTCHRFIADFVLQCGDPTATGTGGPGYSVSDELTGDEKYPFGTLAMANSGSPDTNGSQFFMMTGHNGLNPAYTVFGSVDEAGLKVLEKVNNGGNGPDGVAPSPAVDISSVK